MADRALPSLFGEAEGIWERAIERQTIESSAIRGMIERWRPRAKIIHAEPIAAGGRNTHFDVTLRRASFERVLLRVYATDDATWQKEAALHWHFSGLIPVPVCHFAAGGSAMHERPFGIFEFLAGTPLNRHLASASLRPLFEQIGEALALIHGQTYAAVGLIDKNLGLAERLPPLVQWYDDFLGDRAIARLGPETTRELRRYLLTSRPAMTALDARPTLSHSDFRPANLFVAEGRLTGILDWEFAMAGHPASDLGQLFRYDDDWPPELERAFVSAYRREGGELDSDWRSTARLRDLANLLQMLDRPTEMPNFYESTRRRIALTLQRR